MRSILHVAFVCVLWLLASATPNAQAGTNFAGESCPRGITDPLKCMVCTLYFEADPQDAAGMLAVGRVVMERVEHSSYPNNICRVAYQSGQFVALPTKRKMSKDPAIMKGVVRAARNAMAAGGNGLLGFRSCGNKKGNIGGNCFRDTGDASDTMPDNLRIEQASWNTTSPAQAERMVDTILYTPTFSTDDSGGSGAAL